MRQQSPSITLTDAQRRFLEDVGPTGREVFAPNPATVKALAKRGLIDSRLIGMRWWWVRPTVAGLAALRGAEAPAAGPTEAR